MLSHNIDELLDIMYFLMRINDVIGTGILSYVSACFSMYEW